MPRPHFEDNFLCLTFASAVATVLVVLSGCETGRQPNFCCS